MLVMLGSVIIGGLGGYLLSWVIVIILIVVILKIIFNKPKIIIKTNTPDKLLNNEKDK